MSVCGQVGGFRPNSGQLRPTWEPILAPILSELGHFWSEFAAQRDTESFDATAANMLEIGPLAVTIHDGAAVPEKGTVRDSTEHATAPPQVKARGTPAAGPRSS